MGYIQFTNEFKVVLGMKVGDCVKEYPPHNGLYGEVVSIDLESYTAKLACGSTVELKYVIAVEEVL